MKVSEVLLGVGGDRVYLGDSHNDSCVIGAGDEEEQIRVLRDQRGGGRKLPFTRDDLI